MTKSLPLPPNKGQLQNLGVEDDQKVIHPAEHPECDH